MARPKSQNYKDWVEKIKDQPLKFFDLACNGSYDCEYMKEHENTKAHKNKYQEWKGSLKGNKKIDDDIALSQRISSIQCKIVLFLLKKNAPLSWARELEELMVTCFPEKNEPTLLNLYQEKCNWIAQALANVNQEIFYENIKNHPYSLHFDETSTKYYKYALFMVRKMNINFTGIENFSLSLHELKKTDAESIYKSHITDKKIEHNLAALCLDNCNIMRGAINSLMTKVKEKNQTLLFLHALYI